MPDIVPAQKSLDDYLSDPFNLRIYQDFERLGIDPLEFFHWFYDLVRFIEDNKPSMVIDTLNTKGINGGLRLYILYFLREKFSTSFASAIGAPFETNPAMFLIDKEYERIEKLYPPDIFITDDAPLGDRLRGAVGINKISNDAVEGMLKSRLAKAEREREIELRARQEEREQMQSTVDQIVQAAIAATGVKRNPEHTLNRQVLALGFMLKHLGVTNIDKTRQAKFIEFLIGKTLKDIYDRLRELEDRVLHREGEDARYVIAKFEELGLDAIVKDIKEILSKSNL